MDSQTVTLTLPLTAQQFWVFTIAFSLIALSAGIVYVAGKRVEKERLPKDWLRDSLMIAGGLLAPIWAALLFMVLSGLWRMGWEMPPPSPESGAELRWHMLSIVALITSLFGILGAPLAMIRVVMTERQTRATEEGLITDRINKAVEGLGAVREVEQQIRFYDVQIDGHGTVETRIQYMKHQMAVYEKDGELLLTRSEWKSQTETQPNLEVRLGALSSLQRIAEDSPRDRGQILDMLCAYIRENARTSDTAISLYQQSMQQPHSLADLISEDRTHFWIKGIQPPRSDIAASLTILRNILYLCHQENTQVAFSKDLSRTNLRQVQLDGFDLEGWDLSKSYFDGCTIRNCVFKNCNMSDSYWIGANITQSHFFSNDVSEAHFVRTIFEQDTTIQFATNSTLDRIAMTHCTFHAVTFESKDTLYGVSFDHCEFHRVAFETSEFNSCSFRGTTFSEAAKPSDTIFHRCTFDKHTEFPSMEGTGNAFRNCNLTYLHMPYYDAQHWFLAHNCRFPTTLTSDEATQLREQQNKTGNFHHDWHQWQRSIGFQPDENQQ